MTTVNYTDAVTAAKAGKKIQYIKHQVGWWITWNGTQLMLTNPFSKKTYAFHPTVGEQAGQWIVE